MDFVVDIRSSFGKFVSSLRKEMIIPGVLYWKKLKENIFVQFDKNSFLKLYKNVWKSQPFTVSSKDWKLNEFVLIQSVQVDPVYDMIQHVDFMAIDQKQKVSTEVEIVFVWQSPAEKAKTWKLQIIKDFLYIEALPKDLPKNIEVDLSKLEKLHDVIFVSNITLPKWVESKDKDDQPIVSVIDFEKEVEVEESLPSVDDISAENASKKEESEKKK